MNKLLNPSLLLPMTGCAMGVAFAAFGDTVACLVAFCFPLAVLLLLRVHEC